MALPSTRCRGRYLLVRTEDPHAASRIARQLKFEYPSGVTLTRQERNKAYAGGRPGFASRPQPRGNGVFSGRALDRP